MKSATTAPVSKRQYLLLLLPWLCLVQYAAAQQNSRSNDFADHPLIDRFAYSEIIEAELDVDSNYRVVLGSLQRTRGEVAAQDSRLVRGDLTRIVYEVSQEFSGQDVYDFYREQMIERGYNELFTCTGGACGSSNYWANDIFRNRILYGPERNQYYLVMRANTGLEEEPYISIYIITRGNRRIYAYVEVMEVGGSQAPVFHLDTDELLQTLIQTGSVVLPAISFTENDSLTADSDVFYLAEMLIANPDVNVYLVAHLFGPGELDDLVARSRQRADAVRLRLLGAGVAPQQVNAQGVGPLAPFCDGFQCAERIELVLQPSQPEPELPVDQ